MSNLAVYVVAYPAALRFLDAFWASLEPQLRTGFRLYFSLDGVSPDEVRATTGSDAAVKFLPAAPGASPAALRSASLEQLARTYDGVILLDLDDVLLDGRLTAAARALERVEVYSCAMQLTDSSGAPIPGSVFAPTPAQIEAMESDDPLLARVNAFGFSNSAYRTATLEACLPVPPDTLLMDWLVASRAYLAGAEFHFDAAPRMLYRQHGANTAGVLPPFGPARVLRDARRVAAHHALLLEGPRQHDRDERPFAAARELSEGLLAWLTNDPSEGSRLQAYATQLAAVQARNWLWWEHVAAISRDGEFRPPYYLET